MQCPKCQQENPEGAAFCVRCHTPLRFTCPTCRHAQTHGGKCDQCGLDFAKYTAALEFQMKTQGAQERERVKNVSGLIKQVLLLPITGGLSLVKYVRGRLLGG